MEDLPAWFLPLLFVLQIWSGVWKGFALWKAARLETKAWFVAFLLFNTLGILEIVYLFVISNKNEKSADKLS